MHLNFQAKVEPLFDAVVIDSNSTFFKCVRTGYRTQSFTNLVCFGYSYSGDFLNDILEWDVWRGNASLANNSNLASHVLRDSFLFSVGFSCSGHIR